MLLATLVANVVVIIIYVELIFPHIAIVTALVTTAVVIGVNTKLIPTIIAPAIKVLIYVIKVAVANIATSVVIFIYAFMLWID
jgi:hypothetical protein